MKERMYLRVSFALYRLCRAVDRAVRYGVLLLAGALLLGLLLLAFGKEPIGAGHVFKVLKWPAAVLAAPIVIVWPLRLIMPMLLRRTELARGLRRCPECWYTLEGIPVVDGRRRCPECGREWRVPGSMQSEVPSA